MHLMLPVRLECLSASVFLCVFLVRTGNVPRLSDKGRLSLLRCPQLE